MPEFYETRAGRQFYESTMPRIAEELDKLNTNLEALIQLLTDTRPDRILNPESASKD